MYKKIQAIHTSQSYYWTELTEHGVFSPDEITYVSNLSPHVLDNNGHPLAEKDI